MGHKILAHGKSVPSLFKLPLLVDITEIYSEHVIDKWSFPTAKLYKKEIEDNEIFYLCNAQHMSWTPVAWTLFEKENLEFDWINKGSIMRVATWENEKLEFWSDPFRIDPYSNELTFYTPKDSLYTATLFSKYDVWAEDLFRRRMQGGVFEGSNDPNFNTKDTLYVINKVSERLINKVNFRSDKKHKYVRYYGPPDAFCNVSEITFFENINDTVPLTDKIIGTPGSFEAHNPQEYTNAFDGKTWTSFNHKAHKDKALSKEQIRRLNKINLKFVKKSDDFEF